MAEVTKSEPGIFCWAELGTTDGEAAKKFYTELFGWGILDVPLGPEGGVYTMLQVAGKEVGALYQMGERERAQGVPPHWLLYVGVASADESAERVGALGGKVLAPPFDVNDNGRMAVIEDPAGATCALWEARGHQGWGRAGEPNTVCWSELATRDAAAAGGFYEGLFGWQADAQPMGDFTYTYFKVDVGHGDRMAAGMIQMTEEWCGAPSHWMPYFAVEDCDATTDKARFLGAEIRVPPTEAPGVGKFSVMADPQGAAFSIIKLNQQG